METSHRRTYVIRVLRTSPQRPASVCVEDVRTGLEVEVRGRRADELTAALAAMFEGETGAVGPSRGWQPDAS